MDEHRDRDVIVSHIRSLAERGQAETMQLTWHIGRGCWPGGSSDRSEPAAVDWLRRWGPKGVVLPKPSCSCAQGHCTLCN